MVGPEADDLRGTHLAPSHPHAAELLEGLTIRRVIVDHRPPSVMRIGMAPVATRFVEVGDGMVALAAVAETLSSG